MRADEATKAGQVLESTRIGLSHETLERAVKENLFYLLGKAPRIATAHDLYMALAYTVRERLLHHLVNTVSSFIDKDVKVVSYFSAEYLPGPHLGNNLVNLGIYDQVKQAVAEFDGSLMGLLDQEEEPGLGNGGLGRLASCFMDSLATLGIPAIGYGIRYEFGIFDQEIRDGWQVEPPTSGCGWAIPGRWSGPRCLRSEDGRPHRNATPTSRAAYQRPLDSGAGGQGRAPRHAHPGLQDQHRQHHAPVVGRRRSSPSTSNLQHGRFLRRGGRQGRLREHLQDSLSQRRRHAGQAVAAGSSSSSSSPAALQHIVKIQIARSTARWPSCTATSPSR